jgi:hypothetical protein
MSSLTFPLKPRNNRSTRKKWENRWFRKTRRDQGLRAAKASEQEIDSYPYSGYPSTQV